ncbi:hypothetical protein KCU73_g8043, partial [Aureobasidium melanogenum]
MNSPKRVAPAIRKAIIETNKHYIASLFYDIHWGPVSGGGHCDRVRTIHEGFFNESQVLLPVLPNKDMGVVIGLDQEHWERFDRDELWARYAS